MGLKDWVFYETADLVMLRRVKETLDEEMQLSKERVDHYKESGDIETYEHAKEAHTDFVKRVEAIDYLIEESKLTTTSSQETVIIREPNGKEIHMKAGVVSKPMPL